MSPGTSLCGSLPPLFPQPTGQRRSSRFKAVDFFFVLVEVSAFNIGVQILPLLCVRATLQIPAFYSMSSDSRTKSVGHLLGRA